MNLKNLKIDGIKLRDSRKSRGLTKREVSERLGVFVQVIDRIERSGGIRGDILAKLCILYEIQVSDVVTEEVEETEKAA